MGLSYRTGVNIVELIVYIPSLLIAAYTAFRHGFDKSSGWVFLVIFCFVRVVGSGCEIALATESNPSSSLVSTTLIFLSIGLSPLLLSTLGFISRLYASIARSQGTPFPAIIMRAIQIPVTIGLILCISGNTGGSSNNNTKVSSQTKIGVILYIVGYLGCTLLTVFAAFRMSKIQSGEKRLLLAVAIALPILLIRLLYTIISTFGHSNDFNLVTGSVTIHLLMAAIEEFAIIIIYLAVGFTLSVLPKDQRPVIKEPKNKRGGKLGGKLGGRLGGVKLQRGARLGLIGGIVSAAVSMARERGGDEESQPQQELRGQPYPSQNGTYQQAYAQPQVYAHPQEVHTHQQGVHSTPAPQYYAPPRSSRSSQH